MLQFGRITIFCHLLQILPLWNGAVWVLSVQWTFMMTDNQALSNNYNQNFLFQNHIFFRYLQLRHYVQQAIKSYKLLTENNALVKSLLGHPETKHLFSVLVCFFSSTLDSDTIKIKQVWKGELAIEIEDEREEILTNIKSCAIYASLQLIQYKVVHRLHYSKVRLNKHFHNLYSLCNNCQTAEGTSAHRFWFCPK